MRVSIVSMGPGHPDYVLPAAWERIRACAVLAGSSRVLAMAREPNKKKIELKDFSAGLETVLRQYKQEGLALLASGDALFYSVLECALRYLDPKELEVIPGISSFQILFARIGMPYHNAFWCSLHGKDNDPSALLKQHKNVFFLTGGQWDLHKLCMHLCAAGFNNCRMAAGMDLSYPNEKIIDASVQEVMQQKTDTALCCAVVFL